jgi:hypothetical protein
MLNQGCATLVALHGVKRNIFTIENFAFFIDFAEKLMSFYYISLCFEIFLGGMFVMQLACREVFPE